MLARQVAWIDFPLGSVMIAATRAVKRGDSRMFPVGDDDSQRRTTPVVTFVLIGLNLLVFLVELSRRAQLLPQWAFVPERFSAHPAANIATVFSAMFMHGGWLHLGGNMLFLWIFVVHLTDP